MAFCQIHHFNIIFGFNNKPRTEIRFWVRLAQVSAGTHPLDFMSKHNLRINLYKFIYHMAQ